MGIVSYCWAGGYVSELSYDHRVNEIRSKITVLLLFVLSFSCLYWQVDTNSTRFVLCLSALSQLTIAGLTWSYFDRGMLSVISPIQSKSSIEKGNSQFFSVKNSFSIWSRKINEGKNRCSTLDGQLNKKRKRTNTIYNIHYFERQQNKKTLELVFPLNCRRWRQSKRRRQKE